MSDEQSTPAAADENGAADETEAADSGDALEPNGGPQRVVSEESVDDILNSLDATKSASANAASADSSTSETVTTTTAEADSGSETDADESPGPDSSDTESTDEADTGFDESASSAESTESTESAKNDPEPAAVDSAAASLADEVADGSPEDLAARVERGDVTGADVRAAEAGEDRESTPEIDDVDLSMDDLETTQAGGTTGSANMPEDAGPLAGSVDPDDGPAAGNNEDDSPGLLGRLKRFFSR